MAMEIQKDSMLEKTSRELRRFVYRKVKDRAIAEDIVQDVLVKAHMRMGQLRDTEKIMGWLYQITRNAITDHFRIKSKTVQQSDLDWEDERQVLNECVSACLGEMLLTLPEKYKLALELAEIEELPQIELAERLQISYSGAKSRVQRARKMLRRRMDESYVIKMDAYGNVTVCESRIPCNCSA